MSPSDNWRFFLGLILFSVVCSAAAQILFKIGMTRSNVVLALSSGNWWHVAESILFNSWIVVGFSLFITGAVVWLFVLVHVDVSYAYPFVGLGFILTMILGSLVLGEAVTLAKIAGTLMVSAGLILIARS
jgi:multidrug transporter EmrE-like cation transporter